MRMWMVDPKLMCRAHLLGEHRELHALASTLAGTGLQKSLKGHIELGQIEPQSIVARHAEIEAEILRRGWKIRTPFPVFETELRGSVDPEASLELLILRCDECAARVKEVYSCTNSPRSSVSSI